MKILKLNSHEAFKKYLRDIFFFYGFPLRLAEALYLLLINQQNNNNRIYTNKHDLEVITETSTYTAGSLATYIRDLYKNKIIKQIIKGIYLLNEEKNIMGFNEFCLFFKKNKDINLNITYSKEGKKIIRKTNI
jgi:hypothetical protein